MVAAPPSYQPRVLRLALSKLSCNSTTPPVGNAVTVTVALPLCPSLLAVIVAGPATRPVTSPLPLTPATVSLLLAHVTTRPARALPPASRPDAPHGGTAWRA